MIWSGSGGRMVKLWLQPSQSKDRARAETCACFVKAIRAQPQSFGVGSVIRQTKFGSGIDSTIVDRDTGEVTYGEVPHYSVVVAGSMLSKNDISLYCAVIVKRVDEKTRSTTGINELVRD